MGMPNDVMLTRRTKVLEKERRERHIDSLVRSSCAGVDTEGWVKSRKGGVACQREK